MQLPSFLRKIPFNIICFTFCEDLETQLMPALLWLGENCFIMTESLPGFVCEFLCYSL